MKISPTAAVAVLAVAAVAGAAVSVASGDGGSATAAATTRTVAVSRGVIQSTVSGSGNLSAARDRQLAFTSSGTVTHVYVRAGAKVGKGEVVARTSGEALKAPFAGRIGDVGLSVGDTVGSGGDDGAIELLSLARYDMTVSLSESDIGKVRKGQMATVTVSATGDELAARVSAVALLSSSAASDSSAGAAGSSSSSSGAVSYDVTLRLTQSSADLRPGMTASADIVTSEASGLSVPTAALRGNSVTVVRNGKTSTVSVQTGVAGDDTTEITSGLKAGDEVQVTSVSAAAASSSSAAQSQSAGGFGGGFAGGGGPPAGAPPGGGFGG